MNQGHIMPQSPHRASGLKDQASISTGSPHHVSRIFNHGSLKITANRSAFLLNLTLTYWYATHTQTTIFIGMYNIRSTCVNQYGQLRTGTPIKIKSVKTVLQLT